MPYGIDFVFCALLLKLHTRWTLFGKQPMGSIRTFSHHGIFESSRLESLYFGRLGVWLSVFCSQITHEHLRRVLADGGPVGGEPHSHALQGKLPFSFAGIKIPIQDFFPSWIPVLGMFFLACLVSAWLVQSYTVYEFFCGFLKIKWLGSRPGSSFQRKYYTLKKSPIRILNEGESLQVKSNVHNWMSA